jgi:hypothetical protein
MPVAGRPAVHFSTAAIAARMGVIDLARPYNCALRQFWPLACLTLRLTHQMACKERSVAAEIEKAIWPIAVGRKNTLRRFRAPASAAVLISLLAAAKLNDPEAHTGLTGA